MTRPAIFRRAAAEEAPVINRPGRIHRIVWLVRLLAGVALIVVITSTGLVVWNLSHLHKDRLRVTQEHENLSAIRREIIQITMARRSEIEAALNESPGGRAQPRLSTQAPVPLRLPTQMAGEIGKDDALAKRLADIQGPYSQLAALAETARLWRLRYQPLENDMRAQATLGRVRQLLAEVHDAGLAITDPARKNAADDSEDKLAVAVEALAGEERPEALPRLRADVFTPALKELQRALAPEGDASSAASRALFQRLVTAIFGAGANLDSAQPENVLREGGLFPLCEAVHSLRTERESLQEQMAAISREVEASVSVFMTTANTRHITLAQDMESSLRRGLDGLLLFGGCSAFIFCWLAWLITRGVGGQISVIEQGRAEAERTQNALRHLMAEQQRAAGELAESHWHLQLSERRYRSLTDSAPIGIFDVDAAGQIQYFNPQWLQIAGLTAEQAAGESWQSAIHPDDRAGAIALWERVLREEEELDREMRLLRPNGEVRWVQARWAVIRSPKGEVLGHVGTLHDITHRKNGEAQLEMLHKELLEISRRAGMAEVATSVLHSVGNVLNSVNVASICVADVLRQSKAKTVARVAALLREHEQDLARFTTQDPRGQQLPGFLTELSEHLLQEQATALDELALLQRNIEHIKEIVARQQAYAQASGLAQTLQITDLLEDTLQMNAEFFALHELRVVREFADVPPVRVEKHKVVQILITLLRNAQQACAAAGQSEKQITLRVMNGGDTVKVAISDNGVGIPSENLTRIFNPGFASQKMSRSYSLHNGALAAREMGGYLRAESAGVGLGATFVLELPIQSPN